VGFSTRDFERRLKGLGKWKASLSGGDRGREAGLKVSVLGTLKDMYKSLWIWVSPSTGALLENMEGSSSTRDFERWMKGALDVECLSLKRFSVERESGGGLLHCVPCKICIERLQLQASLSIGAPLQLRGTWNLEGGSYTGDFEKMNEGGCRNGASLSEGVPWRDLEGGLLYW
jgi:hypothetical protein